MVSGGERFLAVNLDRAIHPAISYMLHLQATDYR